LTPLDLNQAAHFVCVVKRGIKTLVDHHLFFLSLSRLGPFRSPTILFLMHFGCQSGWS
jgi:hypothetical protein